MGNRPSEVILKGVSKRYGPRVAIKTINLKLEPGITGLLGPNGAGKTTLIGLISGMLIPSKGKVLVLGKPPRDRTIRTNIGLLPENINPPGPMKVGEFLEMVAWDRKASAREYISIAGVKAFAHKRISSLSKGMLQRVKFTAAIIGLPKVILLDEPFNGIDPMWRQKLSEFLREISDGRIILFSSHILEEVDQLCAQIVLIRAGFLIAEGSKEEIRKLLSSLPYKVFIRTEGNKARALASQLISANLAVGCELESENALVVQTNRIDTLYREIPRIASAHRIPITHMYLLSTETEDIFFALTGEGEQ